MKVRKKLILALVVALMLVSSPRVSYAKTISVKVSSSSLNVRKEATSNSSVTKSLTKGTKLSVNSSKVQGTGCSSGWYKITSGTYKNNYVCSGYVTQVTTGSTSSSSSNSTSSFKAEVVNNPTLNVRAEARSTSAKKGVLKKGNIITVSKTNTSGNGCAKNWYKITEGTYKGYYVCGYYISKYSASSIKYVNSNDKKYVKSCSGTISKSKASKLGVSTNETFVEVDLTNQQVTLYKKGKCLIKSDAVTGQAQSKGGQKNAVDTRKGTFTIKYKKTNYYFKADDLWSDYWMPFDGGIGLHDADWRSQFGKNRTDGKKGSHGCVNLPKTAAKIIYNNVSAGTKVVVY